MDRRSRTTISQKITSIYVLIENIKSNESVKTSLFGYGGEKVTDEKNPVSESVRNSKNQLSLPGQWEEMPWLKSAYPAAVDFSEIKGQYLAKRVERK